jgi:repressor of nif and glnA expression
MTENQEEFKISGKEIKDKVKQIIEAGNARKIIIKNEKGEVVLEIPLTWGAVGVILVPVLAAVGAVAAVLTKCTIVVVKK